MKLLAAQCPSWQTAVTSRAEPTRQSISTSVALVAFLVTYTFIFGY
jgi:hypothetical protein